MNRIHLSAEQFIKALQGEKRVLDKQGNKHNFFYTKYKHTLSSDLEYKYKNVVVIDKRVVVTEGIEIKADKQSKDVPIFPYSIIIKGGEFQSVFSISGGEFQDWFRISGGEFQSVFRISGGEFQDWFRISGGEFQSVFIIEGGEFKKSILLDNVHIERAYFHQVIFNIPSLITQKVTIQSDCKINQLVLKEGIASGGALYIHSIQVQQLIFDGFANEGVLEITGLVGGFHINNLHIPFKDIERITPIQLLNKQLLLKNSNLDNAVFKDVDFGSFDQIIVKGSKLNNISTVESHFPTEKNQLGNEFNDQKQLVQEPKRMAEVYNQLFLAMQKQGNRLWEMGYYGAYLYWQRKAAYQDKQWPALISLTLHQWSTNFGQSWVKGIKRLLLIGWVFYLLFSLSLQEVHVGFEHFTWSNIMNHVGFFFEFLLPTHKLGFIPHTKPIGLSTILDFAGRIAVGYMIYQTVAAFRRFGKK